MVCGELDHNVVFAMTEPAVDVVSEVVISGLFPHAEV
jgi:hypothetical protein